VDEEELLGDEEMMAYIRRHQVRKLASGAKKEELDELLKFPEPTTPVPAMTPNGEFSARRHILVLIYMLAVLNGALGDQLSPFERQEILDYPSTHYVGQGSKKNPATLDMITNNHGYDDERGDYLVIEHDHLAYRYEIIDTLGKGSFGQVLNCRDHATGTSVAIKIIRNKKRFHHQALVEIKILDNLRKWVRLLRLFLFHF
jgi:dual specificity tyrosine-phosphorylation-regulated kinase 2/3/4